MIDRIIVPPIVHSSVGFAVLIATLSAACAALWFAWKRQEHPRWLNALFIGTQIILMIQALIGIKLLDQGMGTLQLYIHYVGGLAPLLFFLLLYWFPLQDATKRRWAWGAATSAAFLFAFMSYTIGQAFVRGTI